MGHDGNNSESRLLTTSGPIQAAEDLTAAIYVRTSSVKQQHGFSLDEQIRQCWSRCEELNWTVSHVYRDEAVSGKDVDREMFQEMLSGAENGWFDVILVWKLDRFSRSLMHAVQLERQLRDWGVGLHSITEQIDTTTPTGRFNFRSISSASELERDLIRQRSQAGMRGLAAERKWPNNNPPLGYQVQKDKTLSPVPEEADLVREIFRRYIDLKSMPELAEELQTRSSIADRGRQWTRYAVSKILKNKLYIGQYQVADVDAYVEDYQLIENDLFERASDVRNRFQRENEAARPNMDRKRKKRYSESVTKQYAEFLGLVDDTKSHIK